MEKIGFYAGSFSPVTRGHLGIVCEALNDYDKVIIGVGVNDTKRQIYSLEDRCRMINAAIDDLLFEYEHKELSGKHFSLSEKKAVARLKNNRACVEVIWYRDLTVDCALRCGATALIRGERIVGDHDDEMQAAMLNKQLLEVRKARLNMAVFPVPKEDMTYVSSSNVRALCSLGEYITAARYVTPKVHAILMRQSLLSRFTAYRITGEDYDDLVQAYSKNRWHHTLSHVAYMLNYWHIMQNLGRINVHNAGAMNLAIFYHDIVNTGAKTDEEESCRLMRQICSSKRIADEVESLIMATAHHQPREKMTADMQIIHDLDLSILGDNTNYGTYAAHIRREYAAYDERQYQEGRIEVLRRFLEKPFLYETEAFREMFEKDARRNLRRELAYWQTKEI